jgi:AraC-like DNA-binding protein
MIFQDFLPRPELRQFVRLIHFRHFVFQPGVAIPVKPYPPRPEQCIIFNPRDEHAVNYVDDNKIVMRPKVSIVGQQAKRVDLCIQGHDYIAISVVFYPCMLFRLTGVPMLEVAHSEADATDVFGPCVQHVNSRLSSTDDYREMLNIVEDFLVDRIRRSKKQPHRLEAVSKLMFYQPDAVDLDEISDQACLSTRQFKRKFQEQIGVGPKTFTRISRLYKSMNMKFKNPKSDWLTIALACGYHDYQHMAKDFLDLAGALPNKLFELDAAAPETHFGYREPGDHPEV